MYAWIWRHLPFGLWGKIGGSVLLAAGAMALLWYVVFPWMDPWLEEALLPWDDSQIDVPGTDTVDPTNPDNPAVPTTGPTPSLDPYDIPYETDD